MAAPIRSVPTVSSVNQTLSARNPRDKSGPRSYGHTLGWDIAVVEGGALMVEPNFTPDFFTTQLGSILDARFNAFLAARKEAARQAKRGVPNSPSRHASACAGSAGTSARRHPALALSAGLGLWSFKVRRPSAVSP